MKGVAAIAQRYAAALFDLADERQLVDPVADDLRRVMAARDQVDGLQAFFDNPLIDRQTKARTVADLAGPLELSELARNLMGLLATRGRLFLVPAIARAFLDEVARRRGEVTAIVTSAVPLSDSQQAQLTDTLKARLGAKVVLETRVEPEILGGLIVRAGSRLIDASLKTRLDRLEIAMKG